MLPFVSERPPSLSPIIFVGQTPGPGPVALGVFVFTLPKEAAKGRQQRFFTLVCTFVSLSWMGQVLLISWEVVGWEKCFFWISNLIMCFNPQNYLPIGQIEWYVTKRDPFSLDYV